MREWTRGTCGSLIVDQTGTILGFDQALETLTGWPAVDVVGRNKSLVDLPGRGGEGGPLYEESIPAGDAARNLALTLNCRDGRRLEVEALAQRLRTGGEQTLVTVLRILSLSARGGWRARPERLDALTYLRNAHAFRITLEEDLARLRECARPLALILIDVDRLRSINDRLGRSAGDEVLEKLAGVLRVCVPDESRTFRLADDDFAIILPEAGRGGARQLAATLRSTVERYRFFTRDDSTPEVPVTLSLGAASFPTDADNCTDLFERAREALEEARSMGRNRVWCYVRRPRVPVHVPVYFDGSETELVGYTRDLSPSGIFVQTSMPIEIGMRCALTFPLPGHGGRVHVIGRVVRSVPPDLGGVDRAVRIPGMGVEFERFGGRSDRRAIDAYLHRHEALTLRPENGRFSVAD